ncbi:MAG: SIR2 family protein [Bacteroidota bacterium]|nr:SIR2 family protein [Bacteroidota bacterium]MDP4272658.1 SIR2 family protein [Bacteroidota bacterium]
MKFKTQHLRNIIDANNDNRLAIFIGAGVSKNSETKGLKLPTWQDLIDDLKKDLELTSETDFLKIAQLYYLEFKEYSYLKKLKKYFPDSIRPSSIHKQIFDLNPQVIITTNWDTILEKTIEENAYIYDVIRCDEDLVKSTIQKKVIKMHGDFKNHNIVFKEDDYLNYQYNFPLIENYVKSILSTHTVLFLGYSYNDIDFKQIMKWLQNYSKVQPPRYLTVFYENSTQNKYLENHGITTFVLDEPNGSMNLQSDYTENTKYFLDLIKNDERINFLKTENDIINFVFNKLKVLSELNGILIEQIQTSLTNCGFLYDDSNKTILEFRDKILTYDLNKEKRNIYKEFVKILNKQNDKELSNKTLYSIFEILSKANIQGIVITEDDLSTRQKKYIVLDDYLTNKEFNLESKYLDFNFLIEDKSTNDIYELLQKSFILYQLEDYEKAYEIVEKTIIQCLKQKNYTVLFISMFNKNVLLWNLKYGFFQNRKAYENIEEYNLEEKFNQLPKDLQKALKPIYNFLNSCYLYKFAYRISEELNKKEESKKTIKSGGFVLNSNITESSSKHKNLILFVLRNGIILEGRSEFQSINKYFLKISIIRQVQNKATTFNEIEFFSAIKYLSNKELKHLLSDFFKYDSEQKGKFEISEENKDWLINRVLINLINRYINSDNAFNTFEKYLENTIFLLSLTKLSDDEISKILESFNIIIDKAKNTIGIYESINLFLENQYNLHSTSINESSLLNLIKSIINKFVSKQYNGYDFHAITRNEISNLYGYAREQKAIFKEKALINKLIDASKELPIEEQLNISESLLLSIYDISTDEIKTKIKEYILSIKSSETKEKHDYLIFELILIIRDFKNLETSLIKELEEYFEPYKDSKSFSSIWYSIDGQIDYLIKEKQLTQLKEVSSTIKTLIENFKKSERFSIF